MPHIDPKISLGTIIQIATLVAAILIFGVDLRAGQAGQAKTLDDHEIRLRALEREVLSSLARIEARLSQKDREAAR